MYAQYSVPPHSASMRPQQALVAIVYANEAYPQLTFERIVEDCRSRGLKVAGVLQHPVCSEAAGHCDARWKSSPQDCGRICSKTAAPAPADAGSTRRRSRK